MKKKKKINKDDESYIPKAFKKDKEEKNSKNVKNNNGKEPKNKQKKLRKIVLITLVIAIISIGIYLGIVAQQWKEIAIEMINNENSVVLDVKGKEIAKLGSERKNKKISESNIPDNLKKAYVAIEDERFYTHNGVDIKRTGGAILSYITHFGKSSFGGSTITQQLVKNLQEIHQIVLQEK